MSPDQALRALVLAHREALQRLPHPTQPERSALDYAKHYLVKPYKPETMRKAANRVRHMLDLEVARGRPVVPRTVHVRVSLRLWSLVGAAASGWGVGAPEAVRRLVGAAELVVGADDDEPKRHRLRVPLDVVELHGSPAGVRRALVAAFLAREQR